MSLIAQIQRRGPTAEPVASEDNDFLGRGAVDSGGFGGEYDGRLYFWWGEGAGDGDGECGC